MRVLTLTTNLPPISTLRSITVIATTIAMIFVLSWRDPKHVAADHGRHCCYFFDTVDVSVAMRVI